MAEFNPKHVLLVIFLLLQVTQALTDNEEDADGKPLKYRQQWVVTINGTRHEINEIAQELNLRVITHMVIGDHHVLQKERASADSTLKDDKLTERLLKNPIVITAEQMVIKQRMPRDDEYGYEAIRNRMKRDLQFNDPMWNRQWYMNDHVMFRTNNINLNVEKVWNMGYTGKGVVVAVVDDGVEWTHDDLKNNYNSTFSTDVVDDDNDASPSSGFRHGTACAGLIAMERNNNKCGVGVAYDCTLGGIRLLRNVSATDAEESIALNYKINEIDIFSNSWGAEDFFDSLDGPGKFTVAALNKGINEGRSGKGVLYVWAAGNGELFADDCNCDGYASSIHTISIGSVSHSGVIADSLEHCSGTLAAVYSERTKMRKGLVTTNLNNTCTIEFGGTSGACAIASGIYALVLQANPDITWRDVQHLTVWTSSYEGVRDNCGWNRNARGFLFNQRIGFGLINAYEMVKTALKWVNVDTQHTCEVNPTTRLPLNWLDEETLNTVVFETDGCKSQTDSKILYLEHVVVQATIESTYRGGLEITLTSPSGTNVTLLNMRGLDSSKNGFKDWKFMTVHLWGENPSGNWKVHVNDENLFSIIKEGGIGKGQVKNMKLSLYGTSKIPKYLENGPRRYKDENDVAELLKSRYSKSHRFVSFLHETRKCAVTAAVSDYDKFLETKRESKLRKS